MRLSTVFELLLICLLIAFAAYGRVIDENDSHYRHGISAKSDVQQKQDQVGNNATILNQTTDYMNQYCVCEKDVCNCCREFKMPLNLTGPVSGCATLKYLGDNNLAFQLSMENRVLSSTIINGNQPTAHCFAMPGRHSKFCGRVYSIGRDTDGHFKACLGLELMTQTDLEATLRVGCFVIGQEGLKLRPPDEYPPMVELGSKPTYDEEDAEEDYFLGFGDDDDDDDDDDDEGENDTPLKNTIPGSPASNSTDDNESDEDDDDFFGVMQMISNFFSDDDSSNKKKPTKMPVPPQLPYIIPMINQISTALNTTEKLHVTSVNKPSEPEITSTHPHNANGLNNSKELPLTYRNKNINASASFSNSGADVLEISTRPSKLSENFSIIPRDNVTSSDLKSSASRKPSTVKITVGVKDKKISIRPITNDNGKILETDASIKDTNDDNIFAPPSIVGENSDEVNIEHSEQN